MAKTYYWTSNMMDTVHTLKVCHDGKVVATIPNINGKLLHETVNGLKAEGYIHA